MAFTFPKKCKASKVELISLTEICIIHCTDRQFGPTASACQVGCIATSWWRVSWGVFPCILFTIFLNSVFSGTFFSGRSATFRENMPTCGLPHYARATKPVRSPARLPSQREVLLTRKILALASGPLGPRLLRPPGRVLSSKPYVHKYFKVLTPILGGRARKHLSHKSPLQITERLS